MNPFQSLFQPSLTPGRASPDATLHYFNEAARSYADYEPKYWHTEAGSTGLHVSRLGFGGYRTARGVLPHFDALREALISGTNVIDTSANYADGASEALVGDVIREVIAAKRVEREEIVVVTKGGYIQGRNMELHEENKYPEVVPYSRGCFHSIHPDFLADQIRFSRLRLGLETIDFFLLHNPEYFLMHAEHIGMPRAEARRQYEDRIARAFNFLEGAASAGWIQYYGVSSNTLPASAESYTATHLDFLIKLGGPRFRAVQFPANLVEADFRFNQAASGGAVALQAPEAGLWTLANRPLNAFLPEKGMVRLARLVNDPPDGGARTEAELQRLESDLVDTEERITELFGPRHFLFSDGEPAMSGFVRRYRDSFRMREELEAVLPSIASAVQKTIHRLITLSTSEADGHAVEKYTRQANAVLSLWTEYVGVRAHRRMEVLENELGATSRFLQNRPLAVQAVLFLLAGPCPATVLAGMRRREYVRQLSRVYATPPPPVQDLFALVRRASDVLESMDPAPEGS